MYKTWLLSNIVEVVDHKNHFIILFNVFFFAFLAWMHNQFKSLFHVVQKWMSSVLTKVKNHPFVSFQSEEFRRVAIFVLHCITGTSQGIGIPTFSLNSTCYVLCACRETGFLVTCCYKFFCNENEETIWNSVAMSSSALVLSVAFVRFFQRYDYMA